MSTFPSFLIGRQVEEAVINTCLKWGRAWLAEAERQLGIEPRSLQVPARGQYTVRAEQFRKWPETQTPAVLVLAPGLTGSPRVEADRSLTAPVGLALGFLASSPIDGAARELAQIMAAAYTEVVLRHPLEFADGTKLDVAGIDYLDERYADIPVEKERYMGAARVVLTIWVRGWRSKKGGPIDRDNPPTDPYEPPGDYPTVAPGKTFLHLTTTRRID